MLLTKTYTSFNRYNYLFRYFIFTGVQTSQGAKFYAMSAGFDKFTNEGKTVVIQFTVKHEQKIDCGGGYVKVGVAPESVRC